MLDRPSNLSFSTLVQKFFVEHLQQHREVSSRTVAAYKDTFRLLLSFAEKHEGKPPTRFALTDLNAKLILRFLDYLQRERQNGARTRNARLAAIRSFLKYAARHDLSAAQVIEHALAVPMKRFDKPLVGFLSREEMQAVLQAPDPTTWLGQRDRAMLAMLYNTGARVSEITGLRIADMIFDSAPSVHIRGKGRKQRSVPLWKTTATLLRTWKRYLSRTNDGDPLFPTRAGTPMSRSNITERLSLAVAAASKDQPQLRQRPISPHTIRHTTAMHLLQSGVDITVIALWLGHESPSTTHMYVEADLSMKERALNRLKPPATKSSRYKPPHQLLQFLSGL
jgi:integrase/recombinase XerD